MTDHPNTAINDNPDERGRGRIDPTSGRWFDRSALSHDLPDCDVVELHLSFGGKAQVSALPDNTGFLIRVFGPGQTHEEGGSNLTDLSTVIAYDAQLQPHVVSLHLDQRHPRAPQNGSHEA